MKEFLTKSWNIILTGLVIILIFWLIPQRCNDKKIAQQSKSITDNKVDLNDVQLWRDEYNNLHYKYERIIVDNSVLQVYSDSLAKILKIKNKQIQAFTFVKSQFALDKPLDIEVKYDTVWKDSIRKIIEYKDFKYKDKWVDIKGDVGKTNLISLTSQDTLTKVDYWNRKWFLGKKHYYSDFTNQNPYNKIQGLKQVELQPTISRFNIGPHVGIDINSQFEIQPSFGISIQYSLIRF